MKIKKFETVYGVVIVVIEDDGMLSFYGQHSSSNLLFLVGYRGSIEEVDNDVAATIAAQYESTISEDEEAIAEALKENTAAMETQDTNESTTEETEGYKVGQVVYYQTHFHRANVKFFKVLNVTSRTLTIVELESKFVEGDTMRSYTVTLDEGMKEIGEPFKVYKGKDGVACVGKHGRWNSAFLYEWNGEPKWCDTGYQG